MLKATVVTNTWKCDNCGLETVAAVSPFFNVALTMPTLPLSVAGNVDLCRTCIAAITTQPIVDYVATIPIEVTE